MPANDAKHRAKRFNEGVKLAATLANSLSIATFGAAFVVPIAQRHLDALSDGGWTLASRGRSPTSSRTCGSSVHTGGGLIAMTQAYALQIAGVALTIGIVMLTSVWIAARIFDRNTRAIEKRRQADHRP